MPIQIQYRRGTAAQWTAANPVLASGEPGYETDTGKFKVGDGSSNWASLPYSSGLQGPKGDQGDQVELQVAGDPPYIQWKLSESVFWTNLVALADITGPQGIQGPEGPEGPQGDAIELQIGGDPEYIQWRYVGAGGWTNLIAVSSLQGDTGPQGLRGATWFTGDGAPAAGIGEDDDLYLDELSQDVYKKSSGSWSVICNIKGATGGALLTSENTFTASQQLRGPALLWRFRDTGPGGQEWGIRSAGGNLEICENTGAEESPAWTVRKTYLSGLADGGFVHNLKPIVNAAANKLDVFAKTTGAAPNAANPIVIAIPDGNGYTFRSRAGAYLSGTSQIIMADASNYWTKGSVAGEIKTAWLYAIWSGAFRSRYPSAHDAAHVKATTSHASGNYSTYSATDPAKPLTGGALANSWYSANGSVTNQRFHIDYGESFVAKRLYVENSHDAGGYTDCGAKTFTVWGSNEASAFADLTYANDANWTQITASAALFAQHKDADIVDAQYVDLTNTTAYRYYAIKIADNWGSANCIGFRRVEFMAAETPGLVWALAGYSGFTKVSTSNVATEDDFFLLEDGSTYTKQATDYCVAVAKIRYEYDTGDTPDHTIQASGENAPLIQWNPKSDYGFVKTMAADIKSAANIPEQSIISAIVSQSGRYKISGGISAYSTGGSELRTGIKIRVGPIYSGAAILANRLSGHPTAVDMYGSVQAETEIYLDAGSMVHLGAFVTASSGTRAIQGGVSGSNLIVRVI